MNKGTVALAIPILLGLIKKQGSSNDDELMSTYKKFYKRNQLILKDNKRVSKHYFSVRVIWDEDDIDPPYTPTVPLNYDSSPESIKSILDHCYLEEEDCFLSYLELYKMGIILDFKITSYDSWNGRIFNANEIEEIIENRDENPEDFLKMVHLYLIKKHDLNLHRRDTLPRLIEDLYGMGVPPNVGMEQEFEGTPYIPDALSKEAYKVYKVESRCRDRGCFIDVVSDEILSDISELEPNDIAIHPNNGDWFIADLELSSIAQSISPIEYEIKTAFNRLFWEWGRFRLDFESSNQANVLSNTRLRKR